MKTLDKSKPYGQIQGDTEGRIYEQDNTYFTGDGKEWVDQSGPKKAVKADKAVATGGTATALAPNTPPADDQLAAQLKG